MNYNFAYSVEVNAIVLETFFLFFFLCYSCSYFVIMSCGLGIIVLLILYIIWDVNYFIRCIFTVALGKLFQKKRQINETTTIYGNTLQFYYY